VLRTFELLLRDCDKAGYHLLPGETAEAFAARLQGVEGMPDLLPSAKVFSKASYSLADITGEERAVMEEALAAFRKRERSAAEAK